MSLIFRYIHNKYSSFLSPFKCNCIPPVITNSITNMKSKSPSRSSKISTSLPKKINYPVARRDETALDTYHGLTILDPYRWLENPDSEETKNFIKAQNALSVPYLNSCKYRKAILSRLNSLWNFERYSCYYKHGNRYFYFKNNGLDNQSIVYTQSSLNEDTPKVLYDPNKLSEDGTVALSETSFSKDGNLFAYALSISGSDWKTAHFINIKTGEQYTDILRKIKFSTLEWTHDNLGIFYGCYPESGRADGSETEAMQNEKLYFHTLGTSQRDDILVYEFSDPLLRINAEISDCGNYLICLPRKDCTDNMLYFYNLTEKGIEKNIKLIPIVEEFTHDFSYVTTRGSMNYFCTNWRAPNYQLIAIDFEQSRNEENWTVIISEHKSDVLDWVAPNHENYLLVCYIRNVVNVLQLFNMNGNKLYDFNLDMGTIVDYFAEKNCNEIFFKFQSFLTPAIIYHCDVTKIPYDTNIVKEIKVSDFNPNLFTITQKFYESYDGTSIPMFLVYRKDSFLDGSQPCLLYGYGGFNISIQPSFSVARIVFMQHLNGILAIANIRGGGEYGENWHNNGRKLKKQNCLNDFQAAAEYLVNKKYTQRELLTIQGGSNGGLLIGACINQRPELFGCAIAQVGVLDMLRFHKFTIGHAWSSDYGNADNEIDFHNLLQYSPLHNTFVPSQTGKPQYPATLLLTADHDDRVVPLHSLKFIAQLQHMINQSSIQDNPVLIRVETKAGHGGGKPTTKQIDEATDILCFIIQSLGLTFQN